MITVLLGLFRLLPFLVGGHRQLALENVLAPPARRLQANGDPAATTQNGPRLLDRAGQGVARVETAPPDRYPGHRSAVAATSLPRVLDQALWSVERRPPAAQRKGRAVPLPLSRPRRHLPQVLVERQDWPQGIRTGVRERVGPGRLREASSEVRRVSEPGLPPGRGQGHPRSPPGASRCRRL